MPLPTSENTIVNPKTSRVLARNVLLLLAVIIPVKIFVLDFFRVSSASMSPAFLPGDFLVVWKLASQSAGSPTVFSLPDDAAISNSYEQGSLFVKRITGLPGDTVYYTGDTLFLARSLPRKYTSSLETFDKNPAFVIPAKGDTIDITPETEAYWRPLLERENNRIDIKNRIVFIEGSPAVRYIFSDNFYFVAGDNTADSYDSRFWGLLPERLIIGSPLLIYWSATTDSQIRWERILRMP